ncbi:MAG: hypothetical protein U0Y68_12115 [Blastocatellia bacterium]
MAKAFRWQYPVRRAVTTTRVEQTLRYTVTVLAINQPNVAAKNAAAKSA